MFLYPFNKGDGATYWFPNGKNCGSPFRQYSLIILNKRV